MNKYCEKIILFFLLICSWSISNAQQLPLFTQYRDYHGLINPATINADYPLYELNANIGASYRHQWLQKANSPQTQVIRGEYIFSNPKTVGLQLGGYLINDQTGPTGMSGAYGRFGIILTEDPYWGGFSLGFNVGLVQYRVKGTEIDFLEAGEVLADADYYQLHPDIGAGLYYYKTFDKGFFKNDLFYAGVSVPQILGFDLKFTDDSGAFYVQRLQHYYATIGLYKTTSELGYFEPSIWFKYVPNAPVNIDFNMRYQFAKDYFPFFWLGAGYSTNQSIHLEIGFFINDLIQDDSQIKIGYGFDYGFNNYGPFFGTSHELNISYNLEG